MTATEAVGSWRVALRLAWRAARRARGRTLLITGMLALPVYAATVLVLAYTATYTSADTETSWTMGRADVRVDAADLDAVPAGSRSTTMASGRTVVAAGGRHALHDYQAVDVDHPVLRGRYLTRAGRAPQATGEVAVSRRVAAELSVAPGDRIDVGVPPRPHTVVGIVDAANELSMPLLTLPAAAAPTDAVREAFVDLPPRAPSWQPSGASVGTRAGPDATELATRAAGLVIVIGFAATQVALLVGAAFAVSAHRRRRELAMIAAVGASRRQLVRVGLADGALLGAAAAVLGVGGGWLTVRLARPTIERVANHPLTDGGVPALPLVGIASFAVAVGVAAALGPARGAARRSVRSAMTDREAPTRAGTARWLAAAALLTAGGAGTAVVASEHVDGIVALAAGTVAVLLGVIACAPVLVAVVGRIAARLPLAPRLAVRHAARHRLRTAASVAAVCAAVAGSTALTLFAGADTDTGDAAQPAVRRGQVLLGPATAGRIDQAAARQLVTHLPAAQVVRFDLLDRQAALHLLETGPDGVSTSAWPSNRVAVGGLELIRAVAGVEAPRAAVDVLRRGGAVVFVPELLSAGVTEILPDDDGRPVRLPAVLVPTDAPYRHLPGAVVTAETAERHRLAARAGGLLVDPVQAPTEAQVDAFRSAVLAAYATDAPTGTATPEDVTVGVERPPPGRRYDTMLLVLGVVSGMMTIVAGGVAVALSIAEMRDDLSTLAAVGALPALRRRIAGAQAGLIVGLGVGLGIAAGIAPAAGMVALRADLRWDVPWLPLIVAVVVGPLVAVAATVLLTRPRLVLVRRIR